MLARAIEEAGLPTTSIALVRDHAERVKPPRALWVPFPYGFAFGKVGDPAFQHRVLAAALDLLAADHAPVLVDFPEEADAPARLLQRSDARAGAEHASTSAVDPADEVTRLRGYYERWLREQDGRTMVGLTGVPQRRWRGLVRALQAFADGDDPAFEGRPDGMPVERFVRLASDDLKAFFMEARLCQRPDQLDNELHRWFWAETAMGTLLARVADRLNAAGDTASVQAAWGIAR